MYIAFAPLLAYWWAVALPMPNGEFVPVMIATLSLTRLSACQLIGNGVNLKPEEDTHGPAESGAI